MIHKQAIYYTKYSDAETANSLGAGIELLGYSKEVTIKYYQLHTSYSSKQVLWITQSI